MRAGSSTIRPGKSSAASSTPTATTRSTSGATSPTGSKSIATSTRTPTARPINSAGSTPAAAAGASTPNEDGKIDTWKTISAEEVSAEAVAAMSQKDEARFQRLLADRRRTEIARPRRNAVEGLGEKVAAARSDSPASSADVETVDVAAALAGSTSAARGRARFRPAPNGSTKDLTVYENIVTMLEIDGKNGQVQIGTMIKVGDDWRLIDMPELLGGDDNQVAGGFFTDKARTLPAIGAAATDGPTGGRSVRNLPTAVEVIDDEDSRSRRRRRPSAR